MNCPSRDNDSNVNSRYLLFAKVCHKRKLFNARNNSAVNYKAIFTKCIEINKMSANNNNSERSRPVAGVQSRLYNVLGRARPRCPAHGPAPLPLAGRGGGRGGRDLPAREGHGGRRPVQAVPPHGRHGPLLPRLPSVRSTRQARRAGPVGRDSPARDWQGGLGPGDGRGGDGAAEGRDNRGSLTK